MGRRRPPRLPAGHPRPRSGPRRGGARCSRLWSPGAADAPSPRVALAVHGFTDYFFNTELAGPLRPARLPALQVDLHKCGRSWREGRRRISPLIWPKRPGAGTVTGDHGRETPVHQVVVCTAILTGNLVVSPWLDRLRAVATPPALGIAGLVLNSRYFDSTVRRCCAPGDCGRRSPRHRGCAGTRWCARPAPAAMASTLHRDTTASSSNNPVGSPSEGFP